jgi:hypothetical protein
VELGVEDGELGPLRSEDVPVGVLDPHHPADTPPAREAFWRPVPPLRRRPAPVPGIGRLRDIRSRRATSGGVVFVQDYGVGGLRGVIG